MAWHKNSGFTIIELIITITIMAILTTLVVVSLRTSQDNAKAKERKDDVDAIARVLEKSYNNGSGTPTYPINASLSGVMSTAISASDIEPASLRSPTDTSPATAPLYSLTTTTIAAAPAVTEKYVYLPLTSASTLTYCSTAPCAKFNLYYKDSSGNMVAKESINR